MNLYIRWYILRVTWFCQRFTNFLTIHKDSLISWQYTKIHWFPDNTQRFTNFLTVHKHSLISRQYTKIHWFPDNTQRFTNFLTVHKDSLISWQYTKIHWFPDNTQRFTNFLTIHKDSLISWQYTKTLGFSRRSLLISCYLNRALQCNHVMQWFPTWGRRTLRGTNQDIKGYAKKMNGGKKVHTPAV